MKRRLGIQFLTVAITMLLILPVFCYDRIDARNYSNIWANSRNTDKYEAFPSDCTNFVSQGLIAGGMRFTDEDGYFVKGALVRVKGLRDALKKRGAVETLYPGSLELSTLQIGDVIFFGDDKSEFVHSVIVLPTTL